MSMGGIFEQTIGDRPTPNVWTALDDRLLLLVNREFIFSLPRIFIKKFSI
jgi:hypothetical protein